MSPQDVIIPALPSPMVILQVFLFLVLWAAFANVIMGVREKSSSHTYRGIELLAFYIAGFLFLSYLFTPVMHWFTTLKLG